MINGLPLAVVDGRIEQLLCRENGFKLEKVGKNIAEKCPIVVTYLQFFGHCESRSF